MAAGNNIIGEVGLKVVPVDPNAQFQAGVDQLIKRLEKQAQFQVQAAGLEQVQHQANAAGQAFANAAIQAAGLTAAVYGIKAAVEGAIGKLSGLFDQLAQARAGFTSILHSEAAGGALLNDIREFARVSPFVTQELVNYSQQLLGVGTSAKEIIPLLKSTGDIISSVGGDTTNLGRVLFTLTQIKSIGALKGQDTMQLQNSLIPITKYLSEYLHKSSQEIIKLREDGKITADVVFAALNQQGEKVKGAMDLATRNISGARAILSDTIIQLFQDQPVLNDIFDDVFNAIAKLAGKLGEAEFQDAFSQFFDGVNKIYEGLKPLMQALASLVDDGIISGLQVFGSVLGTIGTALSSIPEAGIEIIARLLLALGTLKAPLLLIAYITSLKTMAAAILPATKNLANLGVAVDVTAQKVNAGTAAYNRNTVAAQANARATGIAARGAGLRGGDATGGKAGTGIAVASIGATVLGGILSGQDSGAAKTAGGALQGAGIGAQFGMALGPQGAVVGAAIGAAIGGLTSFMGQADAKIKKHIEEMKRLGEEDAIAFIEATGRKFGEAASGDAFRAYKDQIAAIEAEMKPFLDQQAKYQDLLDKKVGRGVKAGDTAEIQGFRTEIERLEATLASLFDPVSYGLDIFLEGLDKTSAAYIAFTKSTASGEARGRGGAQPGGPRVAETDFVKLEASAKKYGFTLDQLGNPEQAEKLIQLAKVWDGLTTAQQNATKAANEYKTAIDAANLTAEGIFGAQESRLKNEIASKKATKDAEAIIADPRSTRKEVELAALGQQRKVWAERYVEVMNKGYDSAVATMNANIAGESEYQRLLDKRKYFVGRPQVAPETNANFDDLKQMQEDQILKKRAEWQAEQDKAAADAKAAADKAAADAIAHAEAVRSSTESLIDRLEGAAENISSAAEKWVHSIKERTQFESSISATRAISNTQKQIKEVVELAAGISELKARGLSDEAIKSLGIDNVSDLKQVRKLLKANPNDLTTLSAGVSELTKKSVDLATTQEDDRTRKNIAEGIIAAAETLGLDMSKGEATALAGSFEFNINSDPEAIAAAILGFLTSGVSN